jgi:hypothetical protein
VGGGRRATLSPKTQRTLLGFPSYRGYLLKARIALVDGSKAVLALAHDLRRLGASERTISSISFPVFPGFAGVWWTISSSVAVGGNIVAAFWQVHCQIVLHGRMRHPQRLGGFALRQAAFDELLRLLAPRLDRQARSAAPDLLDNVYKRKTYRWDNHFPLWLN